MKFLSDGLTQDKSCKEIINQSDKEKFKQAFSKWLEHQKFNLYSLKVSANVKIAMQSFDILGRNAQMPPTPDCAPALFDTAVKSLNYFMLSATTRMN